MLPNLDLWFKVKDHCVHLFACCSIAFDCKHFWMFMMCAGIHRWEFSRQTPQTEVGRWLFLTKLREDHVVFDFLCCMETCMDNIDGVKGFVLKHVQTLSLEWWFDQLWSQHDVFGLMKCFAAWGLLHRGNWLWLWQLVGSLASLKHQAWISSKNFWGCMHEKF